MNDKLIKWIIILGASLAVLYPISVRIFNNPWQEGSVIANLFPIFGLLAATLLWLHAMSGAFEEWLKERFDFDFFVHWTSLVIFASIILHPLLLLILIRFDIPGLFSANPYAISLGFVTLLLLLTYDVGKLLKKREFFSKNWNKILIISNIGFLLSFLHALNIGSSLQSGFMRGLWIFYGITATLAIIYTYGVKRFLRRF
jgi:hypothetical protein